MEPEKTAFTATISLDPFYEGGWLTTKNNTYFFNAQTDMTKFITMIARDENNVGMH